MVLRVSSGLVHSLPILVFRKPSPINHAFIFSTPESIVPKSQNCTRSDLLTNGAPNNIVPLP